VIDVDVRYREQIVVRADAERSFALVSDIYRSGMHFPGVETLTPVDDAGRWRWKLKEKGHGPIKFRATYDVIYHSDPDAGVVRWAPPAEGAGDMDSSGTWTVTEVAEGVQMVFDACTLARIPGPRLMAKMIDAFAREELTRLKRRYVEAVAKTLNGV
jgi:carbon monoxide dehydrogenase subunit G